MNTRTMITQQERAGSVFGQGPFKLPHTSSEGRSGRPRVETAFWEGASNVVGNKDDGDILEQEVTQKT